jgi:hypothetical protein
MSRTQPTSRNEEERPQPPPPPKPGTATTAKVTHKHYFLAVNPPEARKYQEERATMGDEDDYHIESTDAGASATIPMEAGQIKKGG